MATRKEYGLPYDMMQLIQSDPDLMNAFTSFNQNVTPEMPPGALKSDNLISSLRSPTPVASANPGFNLIANKANANANAFQTRNYTNQIFNPEVLEYLPGTALTEPVTPQVQAPTGVAPQVSEGSVGGDGYGAGFDPQPEALAFEDTPAVAPIITNGQMNVPDGPAYSDAMAEQANLSDDPMQALMDELSDPTVAAEAEAQAQAQAEAQAQAQAQAAAQAAALRSSSTGGGGESNVSYGGSTGSNVGTSNPNAYSSSSSSGSSKIVCTAMNQSYGFGSFRNAIWLKYASKNLTPAHEAGYHAIFLPLVDIAYRKQTIISNPLRAVLENIARHRSADLRAEMRNQRRDSIGRAYRFILEPLCFIVGKLKGY